jgi:predicted small integral membrane protein
MLKLSKILIVISVAIFFTVTVINNIFDYQKT